MPPPLPKRPVPTVPDGPHDGLELAINQDSTLHVLPRPGFHRSSTVPARAVPPLPPRRNTTEAIESNSSEIDKSRLIARKPPPPFGKAPPRLPARPVPAPRTIEESKFPHEDEVPVSEARPQRRIPPVPKQAPPPPVLNLSTKPNIEVAPLVEYEAPPTSSCLKCYDFSEVDHHASLFPKEFVNSLPELAHNLTAPFSTQTEKARAIFAWLHYNIQYDVDSFFSGDIQPCTPESTLRSGLAVCDGYAGLFAELGTLSGIQVHKVVGYGKGVGYVPLEEGAQVPPPSMNHAWNIALLDGHWRLIDPCWGAGALRGTIYDARFDAFWFTADPREFGRRHFPTEDPDFQLIPVDEGGPLSWEEYMGETKAPTIFKHFHEANLDQYTLQPACGDIQGGRMTTFTVFKRCEHMSTADEDNHVLLISTGDKTRIPMQRNDSGGWSVTAHVPRGSEMTLYYLETLGDKQGKGVTVAEYDTSVGRKAMKFGAYAKWRAL